MSKKIRILGIAPYEGLKQLMEEYACQRKDLDFVSLLGSMEEGLLLPKNIIPILILLYLGQILPT